MGTVTIIILMVVFTAYFLDSVKAKENAIRHCKQRCKLKEVQLLDETVELRTTKVRWTTQGIRLGRYYQFDFYEQDETRHSGSIILLGHQIKEFSLGLPSTI